jgi:hypothetical protein
MRRTAAAVGGLAALIVAVPAEAQDAPAGRTVSVTVYGNDPCPDRGGDEIVVCARRPENDRYRIPKELRGKNAPLSESAWGSRVAGLEEQARPERPGSCSPVGSYGQTGCYQQVLRDFYAVRRARR